MSDSVTMRVEPLSLQNVCDGRLATQFESALAQVAAAFEDEALIANRQKVAAKVTVEVEFEYAPDSGALSLSGKVKCALPDRRKVGATAMLRGGRFLVEPDTQLELYVHVEGEGR